TEKLRTRPCLCAPPRTPPTARNPPGWVPAPPRPKPAAIANDIWLPPCGNSEPRPQPSRASISTVRAYWAMPYACGGAAWVVSGSARLPPERTRVWTSSGGGGGSPAAGGAPQEGGGPGLG